MNNDQFRKLLSSGQPDQSSNGDAATKDGSGLGAKRSFSAMAPRNVKGISAGSDFARLFRERNAGFQPTKKFKSSATPRGAKLGAGYTDRAKARAEGKDDGDDKAERIKALEEQMKLQQISQETFEALRDKITGGDISSTHLVKGLDRQLLERVKRGEDVLGAGSGNNEPTQGSPKGDIDDELEKFAETEIETVKHDKKEKKGTLATAQPSAGTKKSRDEIMTELKAQRKAAREAKEAEMLQLSGRFKRIDNKQKPKVEIDAKGREVVTIVGPDGKVKKKVRKVVGSTKSNHPLAMPDASEPVLGADVDVPEVRKPTAAEDSDDDIFTGVGTEYNPLGEEKDDDEEDSDDGELQASSARKVKDSPKHTDAEDHDTSGEESDRSDAPEHPTEQQDRPPVKEPSQPPIALQRNYFNEKPSTSVDEVKSDHKVAIEEVLKKAAKMDPLGSSNSAAAVDPEEKARLEKRAKMLANQDRDLDDMDIGFGGSRVDDEQDGEDERIKISEWKGKVGEDGWEEDGAKGQAGKKKRKPKKRKGDANSMGDIMKVIEGRKSKAT